jgi:hypothetical protein
MPPPRRRPKDLAGYLDALSHPVFTAGMSWRVVENKWDGIREAFDGFDPRTVAAYGPDDVERLMADPRVIRNRSKIEATIDNAQAILELDSEHGGFGRYLKSHDGFEDTVADLKRQFRFIGDGGAYFFLHMVDEPVPSHEEWSASHERASGRRGRGRGRSAKTAR